MLRVFIGVDHRQPLAWHVAAHSIFTTSSVPVSLTPLWLPSLPVKTRGLTDFTYSRFLVPYLCGYQGQALFIDADMIVTRDIAELFKRAPDDPVSVVPVDLKFERAAVMLFNNAKCSALTPEFVAAGKGLFDMSWAESVGALPLEWHHVVGYVEPPAETPALIHFTQGIPCHAETAESDYADLWRKEAKGVNSSVPWADLMGNSVHAARVTTEAVVPRFLAERMAPPERRPTKWQQASDIKEI